MLTAAQVHWARVSLRWEIADLANASGVSEMAIKNMERGWKPLTVTEMHKIQAALQAAGLDPTSSRIQSGPAMLSD
jgi:hypothetical protein